MAKSVTYYCSLTTSVHKEGEKRSTTSEFHFRVHDVSGMETLTTLISHGSGFSFYLSPGGILLDRTLGGVESSKSFVSIHVSESPVPMRKYSREFHVVFTSRGAMFEVREGSAFVGMFPSANRANETDILEAILIHLGITDSQ